MEKKRALADIAMAKTVPQRTLIRAEPVGKWTLGQVERLSLRLKYVKSNREAPSTRPDTRPLASKAVPLGGF